MAKRHRKGLAAALLVLLVALGFGLWFSRHRASRAGKSEGHKSLAVLYFSNLTQDPSLNWLNAGLTEMLTTNLAQVKGLDVLSTERILSALHPMGMKDTTELHPASAVKVARSSDADAFVTGALIRTGPRQLRLDIQVQDTQSGQILLSDKVEAQDVQGIFNMVDSVTRKIAQRFAPSAAAAASPPSIEEVATSNLEAYKHYQLGMDFARRFFFDEADT